MSPGRIFRPGLQVFDPARLYITKFVQWFNYFGGTKTHENFVNYGYNFQLISVQLQTCWFLKTKYYFCLGEGKAAIKHYSVMHEIFVSKRNTMNIIFRILGNLQNLKNW